MSVKVQTMFNMISVVLLLFLPNVYSSCESGNVTAMTMEEILLKSDIVVYGKDKMHGRLRHPNALDCRFDVYCLLKHDQFKVPGEIIIESIDEAVECYPVQNQTMVGEEYIIGLTRMTSGFTRYAEINPGQKSAFSPLEENFLRLAKLCKMRNWKDPENGSRGKCPLVPKTSNCENVEITPVRRQRTFLQILFGINAASRIAVSLSVLALTCVCSFIQLFLEQC